MKLPGGLVALAVLNFFFALPSLVMALLVYSFATTDWLGEGDTAFGDASRTVQLAFAACIAIATLLIASGIGYLVRHKVFGWLLGHVFVVVSLVTAVAAIGSFSTVTAIVIAACAIYPLATVVLLNTTFRRCFS
jgi:hypothetical protein